MDKLTSILRALGDPTRRGILELLQTGNHSVTDMAEQFSMSRPAVSKHLGVLKEAGLVRAHRAGRQQIYELKETTLKPVFKWLERYRPALSEAPHQKPRKVRPGKTPSGRTRLAKTKAGKTRKVAARSVVLSPGADDWKCW